MAKTNPEAQQMIGKNHSKWPLYVAFVAESRERKGSLLSFASARAAQCIVLIQATAQDTGSHWITTI